MKKETADKIKRIYHYYQYVAYLMSKHSHGYPSPIYGDFLTKNNVLNAWEKTAQIIQSGKAPKKFCIYIHIPFCECACLYCMSLSINIRKKGEFISKYLKLIYEEMKYFSSCLKDIDVTVVYVGGGTPSILTSKQMSELTLNLRKYFNLNNKSRIIFEASPFTLDHQKINTLKELGIYELALGIQSFDQNVLNKNKRPQKVEQSIDIINYAKKIGIPSVTIDMMVGMPYQSKESALQSIKKATALNVNGIFINEFLPLKNTKFYLEGNRYSYEDTIKKKDAVNSIKKFLEKTKYKMTVGGFRKSWSKEDEKRFYGTQLITNLLGLGYGSYSRAYGSLKYISLYPINKFTKLLDFNHCLTKDSEKCFNERFFKGLDKKYEEFIKTKTKEKQPDYIGLNRDISNEMHSFVHRNLEKISLKKFKKVFKKDFESVFKVQIKILSAIKHIKIMNDKLKLLRGDIVTKEIIKTFFVDKEYIHRLIEFENDKYNPKTDYKKLILELKRAI